MDGDEVFKRLKSARDLGKNIKNYDVFTLSYIPPKIFLRGQASTILDELGDYIENGGGTDLLITGLRGSGKTLTVRYLLNRIAEYIKQENIDALPPCYLSARELDSYTLLLKALNQLLGEKANIKRGTPAGTLKDTLLNLLSEKRAIIAIDEVEFLRDLSLLYDLSRDTKARIVTIGTSSLWIEDGLKDDSVKSSFQPKIIYFDPYKTSEIAEILKQRAELGLYSYEEKGIDYLAAVVASRYNSDVRYGILALKSLGRWNKWTEDDVNKALRESVKDLEYSLIRSLRSAREKLGLLYLITQYPDGIKTAELFKLFHEKTYLSKTTFFVYLGELEKLGLIYAGGGKRGRAYIVAPTIHHPELVKEVAQEEGILEGSKLSDYLV
jgi:Cdc6-like AAA superfamily ATPase